jgi:hypothetical protein
VSLTFADLKTELQARGFDYLSDSRQGYFLNRSYLETAEEADWPFLEATSSSTAPLTITDLRTIESVINSTQKQKLSPLDRRNLTSEEDTDLTTAGTPSYYYTTDTTTVNVYPANTTDTIAVRYWKFPPEMSADTDEPLVPGRFRLASIVDGACMYAYLDSDNFEAAQAMLVLWEQGKARMRDALLNQQHDSPDDFVQVFAGSEDW